jgi:hypothetical protein
MDNFSREKHSRSYQPQNEPFPRFIVLGGCSNRPFSKKLKICVMSLCMHMLNVSDQTNTFIHHMSSVLFPFAQVYF